MGLAAENPLGVPYSSIRTLFRGPFQCLICAALSATGIECRDSAIAEDVEVLLYLSPSSSASLRPSHSTHLPLLVLANCAPDFVDRIIDEEMASRSASQKDGSPSARYVFLDELRSVTQDRTVIRSELLNILLAGRDTTASLLSNLLFEIPRHPEILARLRREIVEHVGDEVPTYQQLKEMKYLKAIMSESQRLYPIVPSNSRQALQDTILPRGGGPKGTAPVLVPKGAYVQYHPYAMHRRPDIYGPDADVFEPTRWLDGEHPSSPLRPGWGYNPFSGGPRVCIGQNFALTEASFVVVRLLQTFDIESRDNEAWREKLSLTCTGLGGCKLGLKLLGQ